MIACVSNEDLDQPAHSRSLTIVIIGHSIGTLRLLADREDSDQSVWMLRAHINLVGNAVSWLKCKPLAISEEKKEIH